MSGCLQDSFCMAYLHMEMNRKYNPFCGRAFFFEWGAKNLFKKKRQAPDADGGYKGVMQALRRAAHPG